MKDYMHLLEKDVLRYEEFLKQKLCQIHTSHPEEVQEVFDEFQFTYQGTTPTYPDFYNLLKRCKQKDLFPMLMFHTKEETCKRLFIEFSKYLDSIEFINKIAIIAEKQDHHPKLTSNFKSLLIQLTTHDVEGVSQKDFHLAKAIDTLKL